MPKITIEQQAEAIADWKAKNGITGRAYVPANKGLRRTPAKRALLKTLEASRPQKSK